MKSAASEAQPICRFYNTRNGCRNGNSCKFAHVSVEQDPYRELRQCTYEGCERLTKFARCSEHAYLRRTPSFQQQYNGDAAPDTSDKKTESKEATRTLPPKSSCKTDGCKEDAKGRVYCSTCWDVQRTFLTRYCSECQSRHGGSCRSRAFIRVGTTDAS